ncbi:hypothetical protein [Botrimarina sp.]|uniref:hypothetical protein n=1 Tax=Botrimarina sp. TaxID=2795802 RepID=UPI0032ECC0DD
MKLRISLTLVAAAAVPFATGCGSASNASTQSAKPAASIDGDQFLLADEPGGAVGVIEARENTSDGDEVVLVGRIGGAADPWIEGRAAFTLLDPSMAVVDESAGMGEGQLCTADCCATERQACTALVKFVDGSGALVRVGARELLGVEQGDMVVVRGTAKRDDSGNFQLLATGLHARN